MESVPGLTSLQIVQKIQVDLQERNVELEKFEDRIIFMSMFNDIEWTKKGDDENCISKSEKVKTCAKRFSQGQWTFLGFGDEKKWYGNCNYKPHRLSDGARKQGTQSSQMPVPRVVES